MQPRRVPVENSLWVGEDEQLAPVLIEAFPFGPMKLHRRLSSFSSLGFPLHRNNNPVVTAISRCRRWILLPLAFLAAPALPLSSPSTIDLGAAATRTNNNKRINIHNKYNYNDMADSRNPATMDGVRVELFFKTDAELRDRVRMLRERGVRAFNLVNKNKGDRMVEWSKLVREELALAPGTTSVCVHYSLKYNKNHADELPDLLSSGWDGKAGDDELEILLVSGSGPKKPNQDTVLALENLKRRLQVSEGKEKPRTRAPAAVPAPIVAVAALPRIAVAFNPFFPDPTDRETERRRLASKLDTGLVSKVYLQFGTNLELLRDGLECIRSLHQGAEKVRVAGSVFLPTKKLIAQQKFRPWNGVFLGDEFLGSEASARKIVVEIIRTYRSEGVELLVEAPGIRTAKDADYLDQLLAEAGEEVQDADETTGDERSTSDGRTAATSSPEAAAAASAAKVGADSGAEEEVAERRDDTVGVILFGSHDVRLHDNLAVERACRAHTTVVPAFVWSRGEMGHRWGVSGALEVALKAALVDLDRQLHDVGLRRVCRESNDDAVGEIEKMCLEIGGAGATAAVYYNKEHTPEGKARETKLKDALSKDNVRAVECHSTLLYDPETISLSSGFRCGHWGTLMPFLKTCKKLCGEPPRYQPRERVVEMLRKARMPEKGPSSVTIDVLDLAVITGKTRWDEPILKRFPMDYESGQEALELFFSAAGGLSTYEKNRSRADMDTATSKLSPHLRVGTVSPYELYFKVHDSGLPYEEVKTFSRRLFWRDLAYFQLHNFPWMREKSIRSHYDYTEWVKDEEEQRRFEAWKMGMTGYPIVDAGMRELYATGWMTQSVRMVVASFLVEYLRVNWVKGCEWFHYTLVDSDSAINSMMWQNAGRSGIDQWNFVLSPVTASQDPTGSYTRKWVPELAYLPKQYLHRPWEASSEILSSCGVSLGDTYPERIVADLKAERSKMVESVLEMRRQSQEHNSDNGYDLVVLPSGDETVVFTKKEYRIDRTGKVLASASSPAAGKKAKSPRRTPNKRRRRR